MKIVPRPETLLQLFFFVSELICFIQVRCPRLVGKTSLGRHSKLTHAENIALSLYQSVMKQSDVKSYYAFVKGYHLVEFPNLPDYSNFLKQQK